MNSKGAMAVSKITLGDKFETMGKTNFDREIEKYYRENKISPKEIQLKKELTQELNIVFHHYFKTDVDIADLIESVKLVRMGSTETMLGVKNSDLDLCFIVRPIENPKWDLNQVLMRLEDKLRQEYEGKYKNIDLKKSTNVSLIRITDFEYKDIVCDVDITVNNENGLRNTHLLYHYSKVSVVIEASFFS